MKPKDLIGTIILALLIAGFLGTAIMAIFFSPPEIDTNSTLGIAERHNG